MASCLTVEVKSEEEGVGVDQVLEELRESLLGELQAMRERVGAMEEKMDVLILDRLQQHETASVRQQVCKYFQGKS